MEAVFEVAAFGGKVFLVVFGIIVVLVVGFALAWKQKKAPAMMEIEDLGEKLESYQNQLKAYLGDAKAVQKEIKKKRKKEKKQKKSGLKKDKKNVFVLEFEGDIKASGVESLREEVSAILSIANPQTDEVVVLLNSSGGMVHTYGLAASQLQRIKDEKIPLTACVDKVAASGGYMMACVADQVYSAPFAIIGSIGVVAQVPNLHRFLKKNDIDYQEMTAGEYKRTVSLLAEITDKGKEKFVEQLESTHGLFKTFVSQHRAQLELSEVATGEYWFGLQALEKKLVDKIQTSDDYLFSKKDNSKIFKVSLQVKKSLSERLSEAMKLSLQHVIDQALQKHYDSRIGLG